MHIVLNAIGKRKLKIEKPIKFVQNSCNKKRKPLKIRAFFLFGGERGN
jgi:hypothetical protein